MSRLAWHQQAREQREEPQRLEHPADRQKRLNEEYKERYERRVRQ